MNTRVAIAFTCLFACLLAIPAAAEPAFGQGIMVGEVTETSYVVQARVTQTAGLVDGALFDDGDALRDGDQRGVEAEVAFIIQTFAGEGGGGAGRLVTARATAENDYIAKIKVDMLQPGKQYMLQVGIVDPDKVTETEGGLRRVGVYQWHALSVQTLHGQNNPALTRFHVVTGVNYDKFYGSDSADSGKPYEGEDRHLGYPALEAMLNLEPDFVVYTGDNVYYDKNPKTQTLEDLRAKWHRQFAQPRFIALNAQVPGYWMKDDHDHRTNDSDATGDYFPSHELGLATFREQVPIFAQDDDTSPTYRTHRVSKDVQIWLLEGRDYRSPNKMEDGPDKTMWGAEQLAWLKLTLLESDATYKLIISPTPMVGPDDAYKRDNHTNPRGFKHEGDAFKQWAAEHNLWDRGTFFICGDRHWQYHSIDPSGAHEFSTGAICDANSRIGRAPGDKNSTDPDATIRQPYFQRPASGGFLSVVCEPGEADQPATLRFEFYDERGVELYRYTVDGK